MIEGALGSMKSSPALLSLCISLCLCLQAFFNWPLKPDSLAILTASANACPALRMSRNSRNISARARHVRVSTSRRDYSLLEGRIAEPLCLPFPAKSGHA